MCALGERPIPVPGRVAVVGVCASGKTVLVEGLKLRGYDARCCAQEHSYVLDMWRRLSRPQVLLYLEASLGTVERRRRSSFGQEYLDEQLRRLANARAQAQVRVVTDDLTEARVLDTVCRRLDELGIRRECFCAM